jgi:hypothetical protein
MSSKEKIKKYVTHREFFDENGHKHTVLVYAELSVIRLNVEILPYVYQKKMLKSLNMGWAICSEEDTFDVEIGIKLAKKRFYRHMGDLQTTNRNFLTDDMVEAIIQNEVNYIISHSDKYIG